MITIDHLTKRYGGHTAVDDISFDCEPGGITGFLGPNGAGKTTTMRILVGLTPATSGHVLIGGHRYRDLPNPGRHVGTLLDASAQHAGRTGREVLAVGAQTMGITRSRVTELLGLVGLDGAEGKRRVRNYSLGMRQRLGLAHALLGDPSVLILDEPANGLDPAGIRWMRDLLGDYAERGGTVLLSSHLLNEVQLIADHLVMIGRGRIVAEGTVDALTAGRGSVVSTTDPTALRTALIEAGHEVRPGSAPDELDVDGEPEEVGTIAAAHRLVITGLRPTRAGLEDLFLSLTADTQRDVVAQPHGDTVATTAGVAA